MLQGKLYEDSCSLGGDGMKQIWEVSEAVPLHWRVEVTEGKCVKSWKLERGWIHLKKTCTVGTFTSRMRSMCQPSSMLIKHFRVPYCSETLEVGKPHSLTAPPKKRSVARGVPQNNVHPDEVDGMPIWCSTVCSERPDLAGRNNFSYTQRYKCNVHCCHTINYLMPSTRRYSYGVGCSALYHQLWE